VAKLEGYSARRH